MGRFNGPETDFERELMGPELFGPFKSQFDTPRYSNEGHNRWLDHWDSIPLDFWDELELYRRMAGVVAIVHPPRQGSTP